MHRSDFIRCSQPNCCKFVHITAPKDINITRIDLGSCTIRQYKQLYTVYYNNNQSKQTLYEERCCYGDIFVYYDYLPHESPRTTLPTTRTGIRAASSTHSRTPLSTGPPEVSIPSDPKNTFVLVIIFVSLALLILLGVCALLYRCFRKSRSAPVEEFTDHCDYLVIDESRITTHNYSVIEATNGSYPQQEHNPYTTILSSTTTSIPCHSSEYETVQTNTEPEKLRCGVHVP
uniref:Uncharacterized protein n=1 Tax=Magallana gigas TaxID=29159 RepID=A0A8W8MSL0_MAGGI|nr:uncharacterized protein LOC109619097 isoform X5 [Crassostrea gigas]